MRRNRESALQFNEKPKHPPTKEYRIWSIAWIGLLIVALGIGVLTVVYRSIIPDSLFVAIIIAANIMVAAAIVIDSIKLKRLREDYRKRATSSKSKAARAEQKRLRAIEREKERDRARAPAKESFDESKMTFREKLSYRAKKSAEAANVKGSGL